ncbi:hypothetical protein TWF730_010022 [Orbilia blumenaviensis]|uniref:CFEM domain-containing protein n=1 Tax=Orbilia blumenaviensis TaxID=1796055 RepID=A0AAV9UTK6_9PEZI
MQQTTHSAVFPLSTLSLLIIMMMTVIQTSALNDTKIDFSTVPPCARPHCLENTESPYTWTSQNLCPNNNNVNNNNNPPSTDILPSCFCNLPRPLICLPYDPTSPNPCYTTLTTWYKTLCESTVGITPSYTLPYLKLPICARNCAKVMTSHLGCPDHSLNCACQLTYLAGNTAECIKNTCEKDVGTYIGDLTVFTSKWIYEACRFDIDNQKDNSTDSSPPGLLGLYIGTPEQFKNSPAAYPQEVLVDDFQGKEYTDWQNALNSKRSKNSNLGVIIPLSLVFGGIFGIMGLQWLAACCGFTTPAGRRRWGKFGRGVGKTSF